MKRQLLGLLMSAGIVAAVPVWPYDCPDFSIDLPPGYMDPAKREIIGGMSYYFFREPAGPAQLPSIVMVNFLRIEEIRELPQDKLEAAAEDLLRDLLESVAILRTDFTRQPTEKVTLGGVVGRRAMWQAKHRGRSEIGIVYSAIGDDRAILVRVEGDARQLDQLTLPTARAVESMIIATGTRH